MRHGFSARTPGPAWFLLVCVAACIGLPARTAWAQQFNGDNQWVAPHGVATFVLTVGQEYSNFLAIAALLPETEFNVGVTRFGADPEEQTDVHYSGSFWVKRRLYENDTGNGGWAVSLGTGVDPSHLAEGVFTDTFRSWFANTSYTFALLDGNVTWDLMPGVLVNLDQDQEGQTAWGMTWNSRVAVYQVIPHSAVVGEVFGTTGAAYAAPSYRVGVRWESPKAIVALTYGNSFNGAGTPRLELGAMFLTDQLDFLCFGGCR